MLTLALMIALQATSAPPAAAPRSEAWHKPPPETLAKIQAKLEKFGLPPGLEMPVDDPSVVHQVTLSPLFFDPFVCTEHPLGQLHGAGDALGTDCMVVGGLESATKGYERPFRTDGAANADWYGWHAEVHAPFDGVVKFLTINPVTNTPGTMGKPPASMIEFERADGTDVVYAHIAEPRVKVGDHVTAGQVVAIDGNNGVARNPHIHVGAYRGDEPLQIRWDLIAMGKVPGLVGD